MTTCFQHLVAIHKLCQFQTKEGARIGIASNSELRRWFQSKCVSINYSLVKADDELPDYVAELTLFPTNDKKRITLLRDPLIQLDEPTQDQEASV